MCTVEGGVCTVEGGVCECIVEGGVCKCIVEGGVCECIVEGGVCVLCRGWCVSVLQKSSMPSTPTFSTLLHTIFLHTTVI